MKEGITTSFLSGKGGVGKSFITANIAIQLTKKGYKTAVIDCDLGFSNLSTLINRKVNFTVIDWINQRASLNDICDKAPQFTLLTVSNNFEHNTVNNEILFSALDQVIKYLKKNYDFVLIDSPAGSPPIAFWILDVSDYSNLVLIDEPTSISDVYRLCKYVFNVTDDYKFNAIINQSENEEDGLETYSKFKHLIKNFLNKDIPYFGQVIKKNIIAELMKSNQCLRITNVDDDIRTQFDILSNQIIKLNKN